MIKSTLHSLIKLPLQIPSETSFRSKKEETKKISINKPVRKTEAVDNTHDPDKGPAQGDKTVYSKGYIKYPRYDFF